MSVFVYPQASAFADSANITQPTAANLQACIVGGHAQLVRYSDATERGSGFLGYYDDLLATDYPWPNLATDGVIDPTYTKLWMQDALLQYFAAEIGSPPLIRKLTSYNNRIHSDSLNFAANGTTYPRAAAFLGRDVQAGDIVQVRGINGDSDSVTLWTYVQSVLPDTVASTTGSAADDVDNAATQGASHSIAQIAGDTNCVTATADGSSYNGLADGNIIETYDVIVTQASADGDFTTALLTVISGSGNDDQTGVVPAAEGDPTAIGIRGLKVTFVFTPGAECSASASGEGVTPMDLLVGQRWHVHVAQAFTAPVATSGGDYAGTKDTIYVVTVSRGGLFGGDVEPQIMVSTTNGVDISGPTTVSTASVAVDCGTFGVTIEFSEIGLCGNDRYYITVTGNKPGPMRVLQLGQNLDTTIPAESEVSVTLYILNPLLQVTANRIGFAPETNWTVSGEAITVNDGLVAYDASWVSDGVQVPLPVYSDAAQSYGGLYLEYRAWLPDLANTVGTIASATTLDTAISGALSPDNPLKWGVSQALANSNGTTVNFAGVANPSVTADWTAATDLLVDNNSLYGIVPLTHDAIVLSAFQAHVDAESTPDKGCFRALWLALQDLPTIPIVSAGSDVPGYTAATTTDGAVALGVIEDDPLTAGTQYTVLRCTSSNVKFLTDGVVAGDTVRALFTGDGFGGMTYSEYAVASVQSEDQLTLVSGPDAAVNIGSQFEVWRNLTSDQEAAAIGHSASVWADGRVRAVWPDMITGSGETMDGMFLCCALAGLASAIAPQQTLTHLQIVGYTDVGRTTGKFNNTQLDAMAAAGVWIVTEDIASGNVYTRHGLTTAAASDLNNSEEFCVRNLDSIAYQFQTQYLPFGGIVNATPTIVAQIRLQAKQLIRSLQVGVSSNVTLGGQLTDATIIAFGTSLIETNAYVLVLSLDLNSPFTATELQVVI